MPSREPKKNWIAKKWRSLIASFSSDPAEGKGRKSDLSSDTKLIRNRYRDEVDKLKATAKEERARAKAVQAAQKQLLCELEVEQLEPLPLSSEFSHFNATNGHWVSIAAWGQEGFFCCDYSDVYFLDTQSGHLNKLPKPEIEGVWCPTGLACIRTEEILLLANYQGHDLFEFRFLNGRLERVWTYHAEGMISPEGVSVSSDGSLIAAADYDGNRLWVFNRRGSLLWQRHVGLAHGVAFGKDCIYVTSLFDKSVLQFSPTGEEIRKVGRKGWGDAAFIWPTSVTADERGVIVSDAHTGKISLFNDNLDFLDSFGGNGPGVGLFNMPYCTVRFENHFWICDTYKQRILVVNKCLEIERLYAASAPAPTPGETRHLSQARWNYTNLSSCIQGMPPQFPEGRIYPDYGGLRQFDHKSGACRILSLNIPFSSLFSPGTFVYFTWIRPFERRSIRLIFLGAVNHAGIFIIHADGRCCLENTDGSSPLQAGRHGLYERDGRAFDLDHAADSAIAKLERHVRLLGQPDMPTAEAARVAFWPDVPASDFKGVLDLEFKSDSGRKFWTACSAASLPEQAEDAAAEFDKAVKHGIQVELPEVWLRNILVPRRPA